MSFLKMSRFAFFFVWTANLISARPAVSGLEAPDFGGKDIHGISHSLADYKGKTLILYFWATSCPACIQDVDSMKSVYNELASKGAEFVSVSLDSDLERLQFFSRQNRIPYPIIFEGMGWDSPIAAKYGIYGTPTFFVISPEGQVVAAGNWSSELTRVAKELAPQDTGRGAPSPVSR